MQMEEARRAARFLCSIGHGCGLQIDGLTSHSLSLVTTSRCMAQLVILLNWRQALLVGLTTTGRFVNCSMRLKGRLVLTALATLLSWLTSLQISHIGQLTVSHSSAFVVSKGYWNWQFYNGGRPSSKPKLVLPHSRTSVPYRLRLRSTVT